jgi:7-keto-8-aminopelargonate synthetase-like enzyme
VKSELTTALAKELASDATVSQVDIGIRAGLDALHPLYRSQVVTSFTSWNVLDLYDHKEIRLAAIRAIEDQTSANSATGRFVGGWSTHHSGLEARTAQFFGAEAGILFSSRTQAILTLITAISKEGTVVLGPAMSALPVADACTLVELEYGEFDGIEELRQLLERYRNAKRVIVVGEVVSATTGKRLDTMLFFSLLEQAGAWGVLDESAAVAHSGLRGAGSAELFPSSPALLARLCSCNAIAGADLAILVGSVELKELLTHRSRYLRVEPPPPTPLVAAVYSGIDLVELTVTQRDKLLVRTKMVQNAVRAQGWSVVSDDDVPILALWCETLAKAREVQEGLLQRLSVVEALAARSLRKNGAVVRAVLSSGHTDLEVSRLLDGLLEIRKRIAS